MKRYILSLTDAAGVRVTRQVLRELHAGIRFIAAEPGSGPVRIVHGNRDVGRVLSTEDQP